MAENFVPEGDKKIYDLTEVYEERNSKDNQDVIVVDGRSYEKADKDNKNIHDLVDVAEDQPAVNAFQKEMLEQITRTTEGIAREIIPEIAERIIREEIEKLKKLSSNQSKTVN